MLDISASTRQIQVIERARNKAEIVGDVKMLIRCQALLIYFSGKLPIADIAEICQVSYETVRSWIAMFASEGARSVVAKHSRGRRPKLTKAECQLLGDLLDKAPHEVGLSGGCWTSGAVQTLIYREFGVNYSPKYIPDLLRRLGFSFQKAKFESAHIDPKKRRKWLEETWPQIKALAKRKNAQIFFEDESSFSMWGSLFYTWSRRGKQPVVKTTGKRRALKVFGVIDLFSGKLIYHSLDGKLNSETYVDFLKELLRKTRKHIILIHDGARYHTSKQTKSLVESKDRLSLFQLPPYSPDFNPIEGLWKKVKKAATHLMYFPDFEALTSAVEKSLSEFSTNPSEILKLFGFYRKLEPSPAKG